MQVNVFVSEVKQDGEPTSMLVLPFGPEAAIPKHLQGLEWRYLATVDADDPVIGSPAGGVASALASDGYVLTTPKASQERTAIVTPERRAQIDKISRDLRVEAALKK